MLVYENLEELKNTNEELANEITNEFEEGSWENEEILVWNDITEFAVYEVEEGWYTNFVRGVDFNGAPDLYDYIDYEALGEALSNSWDSSVYILSNNGQVVGINP